jgi:hypothetical protein
MLRRQFRRSGAHLHATRSAVETHAVAATTVIAAGALVDVTLDVDVHIVVGAVVVEMAATPVAADVADADVAKAVIDTAIEADMRTPVATVKAVVVVPVAPIAGGPESALVGSLNPPAGHPVVARWRISPVARGPEVAVAGSRRLVVIGQRRRRLRRIVSRLSAVVLIVRALVVSTVVIPARANWLNALLAGAGCAAGCGLRGVCIGWGQVACRRIRGLILRHGWIQTGILVRTLGASGNAEHNRHGQ